MKTAVSVLVCLPQTEEYKSEIESCLGSTLRNVGHGWSLKGRERFKLGPVSMETGINKSAHSPGSLLIIPFYKNPRKILSNDSPRVSFNRKCPTPWQSALWQSAQRKWGEDYLIGSG